ncbi:MAG TPA: hypothetical protein DDW65_17710 [Firmicutes bacterium]|jgi:HD-GYP domain-containing protein (c-di-GMP phosphodiesterase class II)|nr:hypothetical protein [Bacillota bacterium]
MKLISLSKIADEMVLARNVYAREGNVLLAKGAPLKRNYADRLKEWGVNSVYVNDNHGDLLEIDEELCQQVKVDLLQLVQAFFDDLGKGEWPPQTKQMIDDGITQLLIDENILQSLVQIKTASENIFHHSVLTTVLAMIIGSFAEYGIEQLKELAIGALLIDVGKTELSNELLVAAGPLTSDQCSKLQEHSKLGFDRLKQFKGNYESSALAVLQHHEKYDGTGFPQGLKGNQIHEYARILAIADLIDLQQIKDAAFNPGQEISNGSGTFFDPELTRLFSQKVVPLFFNEKLNPEATANFSAKALPKSQPAPTITTNWKSAPVLRELTKETSTTVEAKEQIANQNGSFLGKVFGRFSHKAEYLEEAAVREVFLPEPEKNQGQQVGKRNNPVPSEHPVTNIGRSAGAKNIVKTNRFSVTPERIEQARTEALAIINKSLAKLSTDLISKQILEITQKIIREIISSNDVVSNLATIKALDDNIFGHCVAVSLLSVMTGASFGYSDVLLKDLGTGAILVDLGKVELAKSYNFDFRAVGTTEYEVLMPQHTQLGFEKLWAITRNTNTPYIALQHHEKYDGSGFPTGLMGEQINELARIVALADTYDTLINDGINGKKLMPHEVIEYIRDYSGIHFDPKLSQIFLQSVTPFLIGSNVLLNTGEKATVVMINKSLLARPVIRVMTDKNGEKLPKPVVRDLLTDLTLFIVSALKDDELN